MELTPSSEGDFYDVKTASPLRNNWYKNKAPIWINPKIGAYNKSLGDPLAHRFNKIIESIYGISSNSISTIPQKHGMSSISKSVEEMPIEKAYKYIRRWIGSDGKWHYKYPDGYDAHNISMEAVKKDLINKTKLIDNVEPLYTDEEISKEIDRLKKKSDDGELICPALETET
ncbi:MAG: hypothetical protein MJ215_05865 [Spirochaetia bacterium]|nr:hypothetical protein [Spirochaetia bacterium]